ncbi:MAG: elongation factor 1-beta [Thermoplasmata archaeon]|nr:MAG: elongation factor 1-beta [Thermoplasmata archaeon]HEC89667.1 elongation factor 1-beta [Thermoplasmatales archaeon]
MGEVIALIRLMPDGVVSDEELQNIWDSVKKVVKPPAKLGRIEIKDIAFGLRGLDVTVSVPDSEGGVEPVVEALSSIEQVESVEVVDVGRI